MSLGILAGHFFRPDIIFLSVSFFIVIMAFVLSLRLNKQPANPLFGFAMLFTLFLSGLLLYSIEKKRLSDLDPVESVFLCTVSEYPRERGNSFSTTVRLDSRLSGGGNLPLNGSLLIYFRKDPFITGLLPGDLLKIRCTPAGIVNRGNPDEFNYRYYMENHGIKHFAFAGAENILGHYIPEHRKLVHTALITREKIISMYRERGITGDTLALVAAITLGQKSMLDPEQKQHFIKAGVMHVMAVSGLHVGILSLFVFNILFFLKGKLNFLRSVITILCLWMFAFVTGLTPSVLRATLMFSFLQGGRLMQRHVSSLNSVLASAFILMLLRPSVIFDSGFLLSYSAVIFIIQFYQGLYMKLDLKNRLADKIWQSAAVTIVAQAGTLPLTIILFNRFPTWFILTNIMIVPLTSLLIILGCLVPLTFPLEFISGPLASLLGHLAGFTELLTGKAASLPFSTIENIGMVPAEALFLFTFIFLTMLYLLNRKSVSVLFPVSAFLLFTVAISIKDLSNRSSDELIVYSTGSPSVGIRTGKTLSLYSDTSIIQPEILRHCASRGLKADLNLIIKDFTLVKAGGNKILICSHLNYSLLKIAGPDIIIITGDYPKNQNMSGSSGRARAIVISGNTSSFYQGGEGSYNMPADTVHFIKKSGAFRLII